MRPLRVVVADDNLLAREGVAAVLEAGGGVVVTALCSGLDDVRAALRRDPPDVVVTDIRMSPTFRDEGIVLAAELRSTHPEVGVVVLSQHVEPAYADVLIADRSSGRAYLLKERVGDATALVDAVREVADGGSLIDAPVVTELLDSQLRRARSPLAPLTPREREILALVAAGRSNNAIAGSLGITKRAVERHIQEVFLTLGLDDSEGVSRRVKATLVYLSDTSS